MKDYIDNEESHDRKPGMGWSLRKQNMKQKGSKS